MGKDQIEANNAGSGWRSNGATRRQPPRPTRTTPSCSRQTRCPCEAVKKSRPSGRAASRWGRAASLETLEVENRADIAYEVGRYALLIQPDDSESITDVGKYVVTTAVNQTGLEVGGHLQLRCPIHLVASSACSEAPTWSVAAHRPGLLPGIPLTRSYASEQEFKSRPDSRTVVVDPGSRFEP